MERTKQITRKKQRTQIKHKKGSIVVRAVSAIFISVLALSAYMLLTRKPNKVNLDGHLNEVALSIGEQEYMLRDVVFYIAYEERLVDSHARVYSPENPNEYWNLHTNGQFIRISAKETARDMAVHDLVLYEMAKSGGLRLTDEQQRILGLKQQDFWYDFPEAKQQELEGLRGDINAAMEKAALAEQQQGRLEADGTGDYSVYGEAYLQLLGSYAYEIQADLWERLDFGNITL